MAGAGIERECRHGRLSTSNLYKVYKANKLYKVYKEENKDN